MRRAVPVLVATGGVLVLLTRFHSSPAATGVAAGATKSAESTVPGGPTTTLSALLPVSPTAPSTTTSTPRSTTTTTATDGTTVFDGPVATNKWGDVQLRVKLSGGTIVDVQALRLPGDNSHSAALSRDAAPKLRAEALQAQNAQIDLVSGATLTSESYIESLQGALDKAGR